jgi:hypothetical protein
MTDRGKTVYPLQKQRHVLCSFCIFIIFYSFNLTYIKYKYAKYAVDKICLLRMCLGCSVLFTNLEPSVVFGGGILFYLCPNYLFHELFRF